MTDGAVSRSEISPGGSARRRPTRRPKHPALASRILAAGVSASLTLGLVGAMQNSEAEAASVPSQPEPVAAPTKVVIVITRPSNPAPVAATPASGSESAAATAKVTAPKPTKVVPTRVPISKSNGSR